MADEHPKLPLVGVTPVLVLTYCVYYLSDTWGSRFETMGYGALCGTMLFVLALIIMFRRGLSGRAVTACKQWITCRPAVVRHHMPAIAMVTSMLVYALVQSWVGFLPATGATILWLLVFLRAGGVFRVVLLTIGLTATAWLILLELLSVPLPPVPWGA